MSVITCNYTIAQQLVQAPFVPAQPMFQLPGMPLYTIGAQIRTRSELRHGLGNPVDARSPAAFFTSQRTNFNAGFRFDKMNFNMDIRDVRVWGQDASLISNADGNRLYLHQGWGEFTLMTSADTTRKINFLDNLSLKVGRQEIVYDDSRLMGNLDWLQQGRRHDAAIFKLTHKGYQADLGLAFNQNNDAFSTPATSTHSFSQYAGVNNAVAANGTVTYTTPATPWNGTPPSTNGLTNMYKSMQFLYLSRKFNQTKISLLALKDDFQKYDQSSVANTASGTNTITRKYYSNNQVKSRYTVGMQFSTQVGNAADWGKVQINGGVYGQFGSDPRQAEKLSTNGGALTDNANNKRLNSGHGFLYGTYTKGKWSFGPGYEILSGNDVEITEGASGVSSRSIGSENNGFDPLYGTPHRWWGYMDYFYVGTGAPIGGLQNIYGRVRYDGKGFFATVDLHHFTTANKSIKYKKQGATEFEDLGGFLGNEIDIVLNYQASRFTNVEFGYSAFLSTDALAAAKGYKLGSVDKFNQWAYLQLNIRPEFLYQKPVAIKN